MHYGGVHYMKNTIRTEHKNSGMQNQEAKKSMVSCKKKKVALTTILTIRR